MRFQRQCPCPSGLNAEQLRDPENQTVGPDAATLNIQRACEAALAIGQHLIRRERLGVPQGARDVFELLAQGGWVDPSLLTNLKNMVGFRNIAVREYQTLQLPITVAIITKHLGDFLAFSSHVLTRDSGQPPASKDAP
ncbi:DUF86 domain-containing protein [Pseudomonas sp. R3-18-08]|uniref:type VII toxin-antitoxin system HepT family RNase toxin n=1 Tax=Pseudomonas sp. R3-18-08 TaxID=1173283 RepID=UPI00211590C9|nr:DUF86 domain-containing protein [Pseudomonas sp. R3-18-08]